MQVTQHYTDRPPSRAEINAMTGPLLIEFGSPGCGHCRAAQPLLSDATLNVADLPHIKVADGKGRPLGRSFQVRLWPTFIFMKDGKEVSRLVRPDSAAEIRRALEAVVGTLVRQARPSQ